MIIKKPTYYTLYGIVILYMIAMSIWDWYSIQGKWRTAMIYGQTESFVCWNYTPDIMQPIMLSFDITFSSLCLLLFIKPLMEVFKASGSSSNPNNNHRFKDLIVRYTNLNTLCMLSILAALIFGSITNFTILYIIDNVFVCCCICLMSAKYQHVYYKLCSCCHNCWMKSCQKLFF